MARVLYIGYLYVFALPFCFGVYILSGNPEYVVLGDNVTVTLTCVVDDSFKIVTWSKDNIPVAGIKNDCEIDDARDTNYTYTCDLSNNTYYLTIPPDAITDGIQNSVWLCLPVIGTGSNTWSLTLSVPVATVTLTPAGDNNVVDIVEGEKQTFTCTTDSSRPAAWIQWYIGGQNVTNQATSQARQEDGDKFISSSSLVYTGRDGDHNTVISCQAVNIEGRQKVNSTEKSLYIQSSGDTSTPTGNSSGDTSTPTGNSSGDTSTPTGNSSGDTSTPTGNRSGGTSTSTGNKGIVFVMLFVFLLANYSMVDAVCFCTRSTANKSKKNFFDCCGSKSSLESEDDPGFFKDKVLTLNASERSRSQRSESCICLKNGIVTPHERQQPDGHEGPQSTPKDPDPRHLTTGRPLPRRPDIVSPQTGPFDSVNSPRPIGLAPIENPNIPPSIDTLDEQKTDKKPKDKKKKKNKKKKMTDEEQDNPAYTGQ